jgi:hypothetical protein
MALPDVISFMQKENTKLKAREAFKNQKETLQDKIMREAKEADDTEKAK